MIKDNVKLNAFAHSKTNTGFNILYKGSAYDYTTLNSLENLFVKSGRNVMSI